MIGALESDFPVAEARETAHKWVGAAGLLGYSAMSGLARELEALLRQTPVDNSELNEALAALEREFSNPRLSD